MIGRPHLPPSGLLLAVAVLGFPIVAAFVAVAAPRLVQLEYHTWPVLTANHLVTLGWGTMIAIGALYQLFPAAAGVRRDPIRADAVYAVLYTAGVVLLAAGFWTRGVVAIIVGGSAVVAAVLGLAIMTWRVMGRRTRWSWALTYAATATACLVAVTAWGVMMAMNWRWRFWSELFGPLGLGVHVPLGIIGWFGLLVTGVSYYLLPRFTQHQDRRGRYEGIVYAGGVVGIGALIAGAAGWPWATRVGLVLLGMVGLLYAADLWRFVTHWRGRAPDITKTHWLLTMVETILLSVGLIAQGVGLLPGDATRWMVAAVALFLLGWVTLAIMGQVYKVTPFLMWYYRFHRRIPAYDVPRMPAPYWPAPAPWALAGTGFGGLAISIAILLGSAPLAQAGGVAFLAGAGVFSAAVGYSWLPALRSNSPNLQDSHNLHN